MKRSSTGFAVCVSAAADDDLVAGKVYRVLRDTAAHEVECLRIVDESGEDYLYPIRKFILLDVPTAERGRLLKAMSRDKVAKR